MNKKMKQKSFEEDNKMSASHIAHAPSPAPAHAA